MRDFCDIIILTEQLYIAFGTVISLRNSNVASLKYHNRSEEVNRLFRVHITVPKSLYCRFVTIIKFRRRHVRNHLFAHVLKKYSNE